MDPKKRVASIEAFRIAAVFSAISLHTNPFDALKRVSLNYRILHVVIWHINLFCVPFFFIVSGYFFAKSLHEGKPLKEHFWNYIRRLAVIFALWNIVYCILPSDGWKHTSPFWLLRHPLILLFEGAKYHLWFLPALAAGLSVLALFLARGWEKHLVWISILLYSLSMSAHAYADTPLGTHLSLGDFNLQFGPFQSTIFIVLGWLIWTKNLRVRPWQAWAMLVFGLLWQLAEAYLIYRRYGTSPYDTNWGTILFAAGVFFIALCYPDLGKSDLVYSAARMTLGIYVSHVLFVNAFLPFHAYIQSVAWDIDFPLAVYAASLALVWLLTKNRYLRIFVT